MIGEHQVSKEVIITLQNPLDETDSLDMNFTVSDNEIAHAWFDEVVKCLNLNLRLEKNFCWLGLPDSVRTVDFLRNKLEECVDKINSYALRNPDWGYYINREWNDAASHEALNILHHHFELLMGQVWDVSVYMKTADDDTKYQIRQLNNLVHELQSRKGASLESGGMTIASYLNVPRRLFDDHYYDYFEINRDFGDIFLHYSQTGKTPIEAFSDHDDHVFDNNINALRYLSGEYNIWWGQSYTPDMVNEVKTRLRDWLNQRNLIVSEADDFSYYVDSEGNKQGIGWINVAKLQNPFSSSREFRDNILNKLNIYSMRAIENGAIVAENIWDYKWSDPDYTQNEIDHLREFFPR